MPALSIAAFAIIFNDKGQVLLCHRTDQDLWNLPGGGMHDNESPWDGVVRETMEEVGIKISINQLAGIYHLPTHNQIIFSFICKHVEGKPTLSDEADQIEWFDPNNFPSNTYDWHLERIQDALKHKGNLILKNQPHPFADNKIIKL